MPKCSFCKKDYDLHKGLSVAMNDGTVQHFCSSKCRKNKKLRRDNRKVKWVKKQKKSKEIKKE